MANPDKQLGFKPVRMANGAPYASSNYFYAIFDDSAGAEESDDGYAVGHPVMAADEANALTGALAGLPTALFMTDEHDETDDKVLGVIVGIAAGPFNTGDLSGNFAAFDAKDLERTSVSHAEIENDPDGYVALIAPAKDVVFSVQNDAAEALYVGVDLSVTVANDETGIETVGANGLSLYEVSIANTQMTVVGYPESPDNDIEAANAQVHVTFLNPFGLAPTGIAGGTDDGA